VTIATTESQQGTLAATALVTASDHARPAVVPGFVRRAAATVGDLLGVAAIGLALPFVILAIGTPLALGIRVVLWIVGLL
jgi:hypothetical protein